MISHAADGSMRDALSLTDQAIALGNGAVQTDIVSHMLGTIDTDQAIHLLESISSKQPQQAMDKNPTNWRRMVLSGTVYCNKSRRSYIASLCIKHCLRH